MTDCLSYGVAHARSGYYEFVAAIKSCVAKCNFQSETDIIDCLLFSLLS